MLLKPEFRLAIQKRTNYRRNKLTGQSEAAGPTKCWYGRWRPAGKKAWTWHKLWPDKRASEVAWRDFMKIEQARCTGQFDDKQERLARLTVPDLLTLYVTCLRERGCVANHIAITKSMLERLISGAGWTTFQDITAASLQDFLGRERQPAWTTAYKNSWIKKAKAFVSWLLPAEWAHPLRESRRLPMKNARQTKGRRVGSPDEIAALFSDARPAHRRLAYALAALNGLRRGECRTLRHSDLFLSAKVPHMRVRPKDSSAQREWDHVPLHPYVLALLRELPEADSDARVLPAVPDIKTMRKDLLRDGFSMTNSEGRHLNYHALRHTFKYNLEQTGCPASPLRKLMRHLPQNVTDTYGPVELEGMAHYLRQLPSPLDGQPTRAPEAGLATPANASPVQVTSRSRAVHDMAHSSLHGTTAPDIGKYADVLKLKLIQALWHELSRGDLIGHTNPDIVAGTRPDTQVD